MADMSAKNIWGLLQSKRSSLLMRCVFDTPKDANDSIAEVYVHMNKKPVLPRGWKKYFKEEVIKSVLKVHEDQGKVRVLVSPLLVEDPETDPLLQGSSHTRLRDAMGALVSQLERLNVGHVEVNLDVAAGLLPVALMGLELALYRFRRVIKGEFSPIKWRVLHKGKKIDIEQLRTPMGQAINLARHFVNVPPNWLNPVTYVTAVHELFRGLKNVKVTVWDERRLAEQNMGLHLAVGAGSRTPPRLVHIRYRPSKVNKAPIALVGKGITFDTGGLDIKPSAGMRLMKKDMGGSASVVAVGYWAALTQAKVPLDIYLALAENSVSSQSFRPSDVIVARNGLSVEIHNTDAEGRLVLADALDVAVTQKDKPKVVVDVATLTGAIKVALGGGLAGLFASDQKLTQTLTECGQAVGDLSWPMPLYQRYRTQMNSNFADMVNAVDGFGGAVTAALFLQKFVGEVPWAHLDIYAWKDGAEGAWLESGGSGQSVAMLIEWLKSL